MQIVADLAFAEQQIRTRLYESRSPLAQSP
jgi:hypothetical protein